MQFLMERLVNRTDTGLGLAPPFDLAQAVAAQIQRIVECRPFRGANDARVCDFGMPPIVDSGIGMPDHQVYGSHLIEAIVRFEPRLLAPRLEWVTTGKALRPYAMVVHGNLWQNNEPAPFRFEMPCPGDMA
ncbi:putative component of type VI protein secretion system [Luteibacter sp. Sphag1AF]|uniref:hypothetical protein n=1 Tax=Luteibacter sp. Sphag1AF TaxID=2587031 RepID=UPI0016150B17|nr:hypothetical protein [Luteibacter sp. Sphag1AF]MBB3228065.1 putative component of type VI protein secretion system [Luteibacter sp. Sphag1AF]